MPIFKRKKPPLYKLKFDEKKGEMILDNDTYKRNQKTNPFNKIKSRMMLIIWVIMITGIAYNKFVDKDFSFRNTISIGNRSYTNNIDDSEKMKYIAESIIKDCNKNETCEIESMYKYVTNIPYIANRSGGTKKPIEVIETNSGDCDERSFLMASLLKEKNYKAVLIFCVYKNEDHVFMAINENQNIQKPKTYIEINNEKYYYAETTWKDSYIGQYNGIDKDAFIGIYDIETKKKIPVYDVKFFKNV